MAEVGEPLTITEAAFRYGVGITTLREWARLGKLRKGRMLKEGRWHTVIDAGQLEQVLKQQKEGGEVHWQN